jgi:hypothetical protein
LLQRGIRLTVDIEGLARGSGDLFTIDDTSLNQEGGVVKPKLSRQLLPVDIHAPRTGFSFVVFGQLDIVRAEKVVFGLMVIRGVEASGLVAAGARCEYRAEAVEAGTEVEALVMVLVVMRVGLMFEIRIIRKERTGRIGFRVYAVYTLQL